MGIPKKVFLLGVGGMGMAPLALLLQQKGHDLIIYDDASDSIAMPYLKKAGLLFSSKIPEDCEAFIYTSAVNESHPLYHEAQQRRIPCLRRGEVLAQLTKDSKLIAVVGSHGKTTTTGMLIWALREIGFDFSYYLGGIFRSEVPPAHFSKTSPWFVAEVDESDGTIDAFSPGITLALNFSWDHSSHYPTSSRLEETFKSLFKRTKSAVFYSPSENALSHLVKDLNIPLKTFGFDPHLSTDYQASLVNTANDALTLQLKSGFLYPGNITVKTSGNFNLHNSLAALSVADFISQDDFQEALINYPGIARRQDFLWNKNSFIVMADYAHHPREVASFLTYAYNRFADKRIIAIFQPHRYSRTKQCVQDFAQVFSKYNDIHLLPVYPASEPFLEGGSTDDIIKAMNNTDPLPTLWKDNSAFMQYLLTNAKPNTVVLFIGAGDIDKLANKFVKELNITAVA